MSVWGSLMFDQEYNGWPNRETWACALHLSNDESLYETCRELVDTCMYDAPAGEVLRRWVELEVVDPVLHPLGGLNRSETWQRNMVADVGSFWRVDWSAVAASFCLTSPIFPMGACLRSAFSDRK